jgi:sugar phosphate permease
MEAPAHQLHDIGRRRAWSIWAVALSAYILSVFNRSSLGVAGLVAAERFGISATQLAAFTALQLLVYAGLQIPVGVLLDRFGSRTMLACGLVLMTAGQLAFAFASTFPAGLAARAAVGAGDAMVFISVMRLVAVWFLVRQAPFIAQLTGQLGQLGGVLSAVPLSLLLHSVGWTRSFAVVSSLGLVMLVGVLTQVKNSPYRSTGPVQLKVAALTRSLRLIWGHPGTRLGMWSHFVSQFPVTVFSLLWGYPFLIRGEGLSPAMAGTLLMLTTATALVTGLVLGRLVTKLPFYRSYLVLSVVAAIVVAWTVVLLWPGRAPLWMLVVLVCVMAVGGPASMVGFDLARTFTPVEALGRVNGVVNVGGFLASLLTMALIGIVLDIRQPKGTAAYDLADFKVALSVQYVFWTLGVVQLVRYRRKAVAHLHRWHPGAVESMKRGEGFAHLGFNEHEGV